MCCGIYWGYFGFGFSSCGLLWPIFLIAIFFLVSVFSFGQEFVKSNIDELVISESLQYAKYNIHNANVVWLNEVELPRHTEYFRYNAADSTLKVNMLAKKVSNQPIIYKNVVIQKFIDEDGEKTYFVFEKKDNKLYILFGFCVGTTYGYTVQFKQ